MRDVDFLLAALDGKPMCLDHALIYRYRTGVMRPRVKAALNEIAMQRGALGLATGRLPLTLGFSEPGIFPVVMFHDWPARSSKNFSAADLEHSLANLAASVKRPSVHFVVSDSLVGRHRFWRTIERKAQVLEEPVITSDSLLPVLRYLAASSHLAPGVDLMGQPGFVESFSSLVAERVSLAEFNQAFEERVLLCTDSVTGRYDDKLYRRDVTARHGRGVLLPHLRDLVAIGRERDLIDLLCGFDERRAERGWTVSRLVRELYAMTGRLFETVKDRRPPRSGRRLRLTMHDIAEETVLWAALVLAWEDRFICGVREETDGYRRGPDLFVPMLAGLGRDFLSRARRLRSGDPLAGRWSNIVTSLDRCGADLQDNAIDPFEKARSRLTQGLAGVLDRLIEDEPDQSGPLHDLVQAACDRLDAKDLRDEKREEEPEAASAEPPRPILTSPPTPLHHTLATVIGRRHAVAGLRRHACDRTDGVNLILHGPDGVGKRTLAWSFARMILCTQPLPDGAGCGACEACQFFDSEARGCIELDGSRKNIEKLTEELVQIAQSSCLLSDHYVFVIPNADRFPPYVFDKLLKLMEDNGRASFVLLARDHRDVRLAGQSRSFDYRVRFLNRSEARIFLRERAAAIGALWDDDTIELIADTCEGLPGSLLKACEHVGRIAPRGEALRARLGLDWAQDLVALWPLLIAKGPRPLVELVRSSGLDRSVWVRRLQVLLLEVYLRGLQGISDGPGAADPALRHLACSTLAQLAVAVIQRSADTGVTADVSWTRLADAWLSDRALIG